MKKIVNPYAKAGRPEYQCFGCSPLNSKGLQMKFLLDGEEVVSVWNPQKWAEGYMNVLHGGIQATLLDEISSWVVQTMAGTVGVTTSMEISYRKAVNIDDGEITLRASIKEKNSRFAVIDARLYNRIGEICSSAMVKYFLIPEQKAKTEFYYPGYDAFFE